MTGHPGTAACCLLLALWAATPAAAEDEVFQPAPIVVPEGFEVELAAAPPLVQHPIMAGFDDRGRLYLAENAGLNLPRDELLKQLPSSVVRLEDTNGDGRFDKRTLFADKMTFPMGALWHHGAVYVASPPSIWKLIDTDDDGVADVRQELVTRFGFIGNAADIHGCFLGPDGRIYWCDGRHGHEFEARDGRPASKGLAARVFSCQPDGRDVRVFAGGGMDNPVEVAFTRAGEMIGTMTFYNPDADRHDALVHFVYGGVYPKKHPCLAEFKRTGDLLPALSLFGVTAPSGLTRYRSEVFGEGYRDNFFSVAFNTHKVLRHVITRDGATFRGRDEDFLVSCSADFHPTDVLEDADGSLLVIDTGGWFRIGCPTSQVAKPEILGAIYRVRRKDAAVPADPRGLKLVPLAQASVVELAGRLSDARPAVRDQAVEALVQRGDEAVGPLGQIVSERAGEAGSEEAILAVRVLERIATPAAANAVLLALEHDDLEVRIAAASAAGAVRHPDALPKLQRLVVLAEPAVRREAATALGRLGDASAVPALFESLRTGGDRFVEHATIYALIEINSRVATLPGLRDPAPAVRRGALIALDQMDSGNLGRDEVTPLLDTDDLALQTTALETIGRRPGWAAEITGLLQSWLSETELPAERAASLRGALLAFRADDKVQALVAGALASQQTPLETRLLLLETMARSELPQLPAAWEKVLLKSLESPNPRALRQAVSTAAAFRGEALVGRLLELASDQRQPAELRVAAAGGVARQGGSFDPELFGYLRDQLTSDNPPPLVRLAAAQALGAAPLAREQLLELTAALATAGPLEIAALIGAFERSRDEAIGRRLVERLQACSSLGSLSAARLREVLRNYPEGVQQAAQPLLKQLSVDVEKQRARLAELEGHLAGGDIERGRGVFFGQKSACAACHKARGEGGSIGPDLSKIGEVRTPRDLLEAIVFPSASFARGYETYGINTKSGRSLRGVITRETADALYLRTTDQTEERVPRHDIEAMAPSPISVMPQGLDRTLSADELRDVIAFLQSLR
jgi:putative membrane-bound dehydrogenase-like protein